jgi:hypothetical protein
VTASIHTMRVSSALAPVTGCRPATYSSGPLIVPAARSDAGTRGSVAAAGAVMISRQVAVPCWWRRQLRFGVGVDVAVGVRAVAFSAEPLLTAGVGVGSGGRVPGGRVTRRGGPVAGRHWPPPRRDGAAARARWGAANRARSAGAKAMPVAESARGAASAERIG